MHMGSIWFDPMKKNLEQKEEIGKSFLNLDSHVVSIEMKLSYSQWLPLSTYKVCKIISLSFYTEL